MLNCFSLKNFVIQSIGLEILVEWLWHQMHLVFCMQALSSESVARVLQEIAGNTW